MRLWIIYKTLSTTEERKLILCLSVLYGITSIALVGYPLWFKEPEIICKKDGGQEKVCFESEACGPGNYIIDQENGINSLVTNFHLICDSGRTIRRRVISIGLFGYFIGLFINSFIINIDASERKNFLANAGLIFSLAAFSSVYFFSPYIYLVAICISVMSMSYGMIFANSINFIYECFEPKFSEVAYIIMSLFWGVFGLCFPSLALLTNTNWKVLNIFCALVAAFAGYYLKELNENVRDIPFNEQSQKDIHTVWSILKALRSQPSLRENYILFLTVWFTFTLTHNGSFLELETIGGNVYINLGIFAMIEMCSSFLTGFSLRSDKKLLKLMLVLSFFNASLFMIYFHYPVNERFEDSLGNILKFVLPVLIAKTICELSWNLLVLLLPSLFELELLSKIVSLCIFLCRIPISIIAYIHYLSTSLGFHPFVFYGVLWVVTGFCIKKMHLHENSIKNISKRARLSNGLSSIYGLPSPLNKSTLSEILLEEFKLDEKTEFQIPEDSELNGSESKEFTK